VLGVIGANVGGARLVPPTIRVVFWGAPAMAVTTGVGMLVGKAV
jgi:VIT1/CCC1 family predicted Fe2+/Mn2+ transporter